jgi:hypothetical protein
MIAVTRPGVIILLMEVPQRIPLPTLPERELPMRFSACRHETVLPPASLACCARRHSSLRGGVRDLDASLRFYGTADP